MTATTALTAQNTTGVSAIHAVPPAFVRQQLDAVFDDMGADVIKTGMLASGETIRAVADALEAHCDAGHRLVVDPVMVATTGAELLPSEAVRELRQRLLPRATVLTPNVPEARRLLADASPGGEDQLRLESVADLEAVAERLLEMGPEWVLVKGGHVPFRRDGALARTPAEREVVVDVLAGRAGERLRIETAWAESRNTHGTGCSLACEFTSSPRRLSHYSSLSSSVVALSLALFSRAHRTSLQKCHMSVTRLLG